MAVLTRLTVEPASHEQFLELDTRVGQLLMSSGGPPSALMANIVHPDGDGFVVTSVWRTEVEAKTWVQTFLHPLLTDLGLAAVTEVRPVWSFATA